ncbi:hypothetical protein [Kordia periserrulae]|nr:hypothetical protein [Kordia periserrulae]
MRFVYFFVLNFYAFIGFSQPNSFEKGKILPEISVNNSSETYALYLPKSFDETVLSAVVFIFDPSGNGVNGMQHFVTSAEKFNYILVASNNTKNGVPYDTNFEITNRLFATIFSTFKIDERQIYAAGFSGGSRLATAIAALTGKIQGVIACGAGLAINKSVTPTQKMFSFIGLVGDEDMNYQEMFNTKTWLDQFSVANELFVYNDTHRWPPSEQIERAFGWLELQAYKKAIRSIDSQFVQSYFETQYKIADSLVIHNKFRAVHEYESIMRNFAPYFEIDATQQKVIAIKKSPEYQQQVAARAAIIQEENDLYEKFSKVYSNDILAAESTDNFQWWRKELHQLNTAITQQANSPRGKMLKRLKYSIFAGAYESSESYVAAKKYKHALYCNQLLVYFNPEKAYWYFRVAQSYAHTNDFKNTIRNLKKAKDLGLPQFERIQQLPLFAKFKQKRRFQKLFEVSEKDK